MNVLPFVLDTNKHLPGKIFAFEFKQNHHHTLQMCSSISLLTLGLIGKYSPPEKCLNVLLHVLHLVLFCHCMESSIGCNVVLEHVFNALAVDDSHKEEMCLNHAVPKHGHVTEYHAPIGQLGH
jgi:hypothetical protein